jgi:protein SCO1
MKRSIVLLAMGAAAAVLAPSGAQVPPPPDPFTMSGPRVQDTFSEISIEQNLGAQVPLDLRFLNESGQPVTIGELLAGRPAVLSLVYYECPMICNEILNGMVAAFDGAKYSIGKDYVVLTVTIDPGESPALAREKKANYLKHYSRGGGAEGWHFLTIHEQADLDTLAEVVGYRYAYDPATDQYAHASGIMVLTPEGTVARYFYGIDYIPRDLDFTLVEASAGKVGSPVDKLVLLCFQYDPALGTYGFYIIGAMRLGAVMTLGFLALFWLSHYVTTRRRARAASAGEREPAPHRVHGS